MPKSSGAARWSPVKDGQWIGIDWTPSGWIGQHPVDPYLVWADATNAVDFGPAPRLTPVLIELPVGLTARTFYDDFYKLLNPASVEIEKVLQIPDLYLHQTRIKSRFLTARVTRLFFKLLEKPGAWNLLKRVQIALPILSVGPVIQSQPVVVAGGPRYDAVIGIIDDGLAFANVAFRDRIKFFWNQDSITGTIPPPFGFSYGAEYGPSTGTSGNDPGLMALTMAKASRGGMQPLDEEAVYQMAGLMQLRRRVTHGAAVMDIATRAPAAANAAIICVQLPTHVTQDTSGASLGAYVLDALRYIVACADKIGKDLPVVVNLSYGDIAGPHDGTSMIEAAIDDFTTACKKSNGKPRVAVVIPAGNSYLSRCHAEFKLEWIPAVPDPIRPYTHALTWRIHPDDATPSFLEIWLPKGNDGSSVSVEVVPPGERSGVQVSIGSAWTWPDATDPKCTVVFPTLSGNSSGLPAMPPIPPFFPGSPPVLQRLAILIATAPTASLAARSLAPSGAWKVIVRSQVPINQTIDAWIQRDDSPFGYPRRGRQSYFDDPAYVRFTQNGYPCESDITGGLEGNPALAYVKRAGTLNAIATGRTMIVPAGYRASDDQAVRYSSNGPPPPLLAQVSEDSVAHHGVLAAGTHSGSATAFGGTSIAAPQAVNELVGIVSRSPVAKLTQSAPPPDAKASLAGDNGTGPPPPAEVRGLVVIYADRATGQLPAKDGRIGYGKLGPPSRAGRPYRRESEKP